MFRSGADLTYCSNRLTAGLRTTDNVAASVDFRSGLPTRAPLRQRTTEARTPSKVLAGRRSTPRGRGRGERTATWERSGWQGSVGARLAELQTEG